MARLVKKLFTQAGQWTAPPGITEVILIGCGGGGGGGSGGTGASQAGGGGGGGALQGVDHVAVTPGFTYNIIIGGGGSGGTLAGVGGYGGDTTFGNLSAFGGASGGGGGTGTNLSAGGQCVKTAFTTTVANLYCSTNSGATTNPATVTSAGTAGYVYMGPASGGYASETAPGMPGAKNPVGNFLGGFTTSGNSTGGGGGAGPRGAGGAGGKSGVAGGSGGFATGAGGGGGCGTNGQTTSNGGSGGSGYVIVCYVI